MHTKAQIKVIKKNAQFYKTTSVRREKPKRNTAREVALTVSGWVNEFQLRSKETNQTFDCLFAQN